MKMGRSLVLAAVAALTLPALAHAAGYQIYEQGAAVLGMAGAGTASVKDASAVFYNPANLARMPGIKVYVGGSALGPTTDFKGDNPFPGASVSESMTEQWFFPPHAYATWSNGRWGFGAGINAPYGLGTEWEDPDTFTGRYISTKSELEVLNGSAVVSYAVTPQLSIGAGYNYAMANVNLHRRLFVPGFPPATEIGKLDLEADWSGNSGWNAAVTLQPEDVVRIAFTYRSEITIKPEGDATFTKTTALPITLPPNQGVNTVLRLPAIWSLGWAIMPNEQWTIEADANLTQWSAFEDLPLYFETTPSQNTTVEENYRDAFQIRLGAEHRLPAFTYRFGYYYDQFAAPPEAVSPILPDASRQGVTLGFGKDFGLLTLDAYYLGLFVQDRSTEGVSHYGYNGSYETFINIFGVGIGMDF